MSSLIPALDLGAFYQPSTSQLTLSAQGEVPYVVLGQIFKRDKRFVGGLKFSLHAWQYGGFGHGPNKPYSYSQTFTIPNLDIVVPSGKIIIVTANHPKGIAVTVRWGGFGEDLPKDLFDGAETSAIESVSEHDLPETPIAEAIRLDVLVGIPFTIKALLPGDPSGSVDIDFNPYTFSLKNAAVKSGDINWEIVASVAGPSIISVDTIPFIAKPPAVGLPYIIPTVYDIRAHYPLDGPSILPIDTVSIASTKKPAAVTFLQRVNEALELVRSEVLDAETLEVRASPRGPFTFPGLPDPIALSALVATFKTSKGEAITRLSPFNEWSPPVFVQDIRVGVTPFKLEGLLDIVAAGAKLRQAGVHEGFVRAELSEVLYEVQAPEAKQPDYVFTLDEGSQWRVGAKDGKVSAVGEPTFGTKGKKQLNGN